MKEYRIWGKLATAVGSGTADPIQSASASSPVPSIVSANKPAPGRTGPRGLAPRTTYSKVNTGTPPRTGVGMEAKSLPPRGMEFLPRKTAQANMRTSMSRPSLEDLRAAAMEGTIDKVAVAREAERQLRGASSAKTAEAPSDHIPTELVTKLASAMQYIAKLAESGSVQMVGEGPNTLEVSEATNASPMPGPGEMGKGTEKHQPDRVPSTQVEKKQPGKANTGMETNDETHLPPYPTEPIANQDAPMHPPTTIPPAKQAMVQANLQRLMKVGSPTHVSNGVPISFIRKMAEDALNPAQISVPNKDVKPPATETGEGVPTEPSDVNAQKNMISGNQAATDYTKGQAKKDPVKDVEQVVTEPAMKDPVLDQVLNQGTETSKMSMAKTAYQIAAARALLSKLAEEQKEKEEKAKEEEEGKKGKDKSNGKKPPFVAEDMDKEKEGQLGPTATAQFKGPPPTPVGATGFSTGSGMA